jgi:PBSX family phage terminase large subunit
MAITKQQVKHEFWRRGLIEYNLHSVQKEMVDIYNKSTNNSILVWLLARQTGKTYALLTLGVKECLTKPYSIVKYLTDTKLHARTLAEPQMRRILEDCPEDLKPEYIQSQFLYVFKNGSQLQMAGSDGNSAERLRGQTSNLVLVDEAGFVSNLDNIMKDILLPTLIHSGGRTILASSPPKEPDHDFVQYIERAEQEKLLTVKTVYDNPLLDQEQIDNIIKQYPGGVNSSGFRREFMCEMIKDENLAVLPEVDDELLEQIVKEHELPPFYHKYVAMDIGFKDLTVVLYGYYDFREDKIIIQDEIVKNGKEIHLPVFTRELQEKERELWVHPLTHEFMKPDMRVSDINPFVIQEINIYSKKHNPEHPLDFSIASKHDKLANINKLRVMLANQKIIINPKCETTIRHLKHCKWKDKSAKDDFARSQDDGHYDAVDALLYFTRAVNYNKNPYPLSYGFDIKNLHVENRSKFGGQTTAQVYNTIFGVSNKKSR